MTPIIFDGRSFAQSKEENLRTQIVASKHSYRMGNLVFVEDEAGMKYTQLKKQAAVRVGIEFSVEEMSMHSPIDTLKTKIYEFSQRADFHGTMIQKPAKADWNKLFQKQGGRFDGWWQMLTNSLNPDKDVDCLMTENLQRVYSGNWRLLPATVKAIVSVLASLDQNLLPRQNLENFTGLFMVVVGRSDIVGAPLTAVLRQYGARVENYGSNLDLEQLARADVVVSATGVQSLIQPDMVKPGVVVLDVGFPKPDVDPAVAEKASFFTPVPHGIGPVTVVSLLENLWELAAS